LSWLKKLKNWCWFRHIATEYYAKKYINLKDKVLLIYEI